LNEEALLRFRFKLTDENIDQLQFISTLREICIRVGIQVNTRDYRTEPYTEDERATFAAEDAAAQTALDRKKQELSHARNKKAKKQIQNKAETVVRSSRRNTTFIPEDIFNIMPTVKQSFTRSVFAEETFEAGKMSLNQGHRELGLDLLLESLTLHEQTYGFLHPETSKCYATLAMVYHHGGQAEPALDFQRKAVISSERTCGVDHPETIHHYVSYIINELYIMPLFMISVLFLVESWFV
jgi:protein TIF31